MQSPFTRLLSDILRSHIVSLAQCYDVASSRCVVKEAGGYPVECA